MASALYPLSAGADFNQPSRHIALIGLMGAGKTEVGAAVARRVNLKHIDLDRAVTQLAGRSIGVIFHEGGEQSFRDFESKSLVSHLEAEEPIVLSTGGGVLCREANWEALSVATVVWLRATPATLAERVGGGGSRPLLADGDPLSLLTNLAVEREPAYSLVADLIIDTDGLNVDEVADALVLALDGLQSSGGPQ